MMLACLGPINLLDTNDELMITSWYQEKVILFKLKTLPVFFKDILKQQSPTFLCATNRFNVREYFHGPDFKMSWINKTK